MKRLRIFTVLALSLALLLSATVVTEAKIDSYLSVTGGTTSPGSAAAITVFLNSEEQISACRIFIEADTSVFSAALNSDGKSYAVEKGDVTKSGTMLASAYGTKGWQVFWYNTSDVAANGTFCRLPITLAEDAKPGIYKIKVSYSADNTINSSGDPVSFTCLTGAVRVIEDIPAIYSALDRTDICAPVCDIDIPVAIRRNPGLTGLCIEFTDNENFEVLLENGEPYVILDVDDGGMTFLCSKTDGKTTLLWFGAQMNTDNKFLCYVRCRIKGNPGDVIKIPMTLDKDNTIGDDYMPVDLALDLDDITIGDVFEIDDLYAGYSFNMQGYVTVVVLPEGVDLVKDAVKFISSCYDENGKMISANTFQYNNYVDELYLFMPSDIDAVESIKLFMLDPATLVPIFPARDVEIDHSTDS